MENYYTKPSQLLFSARKGKPIKHDGEPAKAKGENTKYPSGFSLVELLVVVAILAILAAIAIPLFLNQRSKAAQGAVQSDARNLATNLNTLFANLPRSANPNVALNGSTAVNTTLSGSGTIEVDGETLNVNLSPDVAITKTGNADPAVGAGLKITHAGVENWACVIPLPFSVEYAQTSTFQPTCGTVVSDTGNLFDLEFSTGESFPASIPWITGNATSSDYVPGFGASSLVALTSSHAARLQYFGGSTVGNLPVLPGETYTLTYYIKSYEVNPINKAPTVWLWQSDQRTTAGYLILPSQYTETIDGGWNKRLYTFTVPEANNPRYISLGIYINSGSETGKTYYLDDFGFWKGDGGDWVPTGVPIVKQ